MTLYELTNQPQGVIVQGGEAIACEWGSADDNVYPRMFEGTMLFMDNARDAQDIGTAKKAQSVESLADWLEENGVELVYANGATPEDFEVPAEMWTTESGVIIIAPDGWF